MSKSFQSMSADEQNKLVADLGDMIQKHGISADVKTTREVVCDVKGTSIDDNHTLAVKAELGQDMKEKVEAFKKESADLVKDVEGATVSVSCVVGAGSKYAEITKVTTIEDASTETSIKHKQGDVMLIDFWATWCPPCQAPMKHNQDMLEKHGEDWKNKKIRIIGLSIDQSADKVLTHVEANKCDVYGVKGVPHVMLIDQHGTIVFKGHPSGRPNLEKDLEKLAKGEELEGDNISKLKVEDEGAAGATVEIKTPEGFEERDCSGIAAEIDAFKVKCSEFQANEEIKTAAKGMQRSFCVIVYQNSYNPSNQKSSAKYDNYRVVIGKQEQVDTVKKAIIDSMEAGSFTFKVTDQFHVTP